MSEPVWLRPTKRAERLDRVQSAFRERFDREPEGVWGAPGRVNLIGEHTDYNGGLCLPIALPHTTVVAAAASPDRLILHSVQSPDEPFDGALADVGPGRPAGWPAYVAGVPWALAEQGLPAVGLRAVIDGEVPLGAGLSSSAALESSAALAVDALAGLGLGDSDEGRARLAAACIEAENVVAGAPTGGMDQAASLRCTAGHALLLDCRDGSVQQVPFDPAAAGLAVLVIDTQAPHRLVDGQYAERRDSCEAAAAALGVPTLREACELPLDDVLGRLDDPVLRRRTKHIVTEIGRVEQVVALLEAGRIRDLGPVLDESHLSMRDDFEISSPELDLAVATAQASGALGARMTGGGFGGSALALVPVEALDTVAEKVTAAFADAGMDAPRFLVAEPSPGAIRWA